MNARTLVDRISTEQRLLLQAVLRQDGRAASAFEEWRTRIDIADVDNESHRLLPLLARRMDDLAPNDPVRALVRGVYRTAWVKNRLLTRDAAGLARALQANGVEVLVLKGAALVAYYDGDWGMRPMYDLDVLVPAAQLETALDVLQREGWHSRAGVSAQWILRREAPRRHSFPFSRDIEDELDLHWHVLADAVDERDDAGFWAHAQTVDIAGAAVLALDEPDLLLHVIAHGARSPERGNVQWVADATHIVRGARDARLGERLADRARVHGLLPTIRAALDAVDMLIDDQSVAAVRDAVPPSPGPSRARQVKARWHAARTAIDPAFVTRPTLYALYTAAGQPAALGRAARRVTGPLSRTVRTPERPYRLGDEIDFTATDPGDATVADTVDRHASVGWWAVDDKGLWSRGPEARVVLDVDASTVPPDRPLELQLDARSYDASSRAIEVRVNDVVVGTITVGPVDVAADVRVGVPAELVALGPIDITFVAPRNGIRARPPVGLRLRRLQLRAG